MRTERETAGPSTTLRSGPTATCAAFSKVDMGNGCTTNLGTPAGTATWTLSAEGKTLTTSFMALGPDATREPPVSVYVKQ